VIPLLIPVRCDKAFPVPAIAAGLLVMKNSNSSRSSKIDDLFKVWAEAWGVRFFKSQKRKILNNHFFRTYMIDAMVIEKTMTVCAKSVRIVVGILL
jgi:hypothetical protein